MSFIVGRILGHEKSLFYYFIMLFIIKVISKSFTKETQYIYLEEGEFIIEHSLCGLPQWKLVVKNPPANAGDVSDECLVLE